MNHAAAVNRKGGGVRPARPVGTDPVPDILTEETFPFRELAKRASRFRGGKRLDVATIHRWASHGLHGIKLEYVQVGGSRSSSLEALGRFFTALTCKSRGETQTPTLRSPAARAKAIRAADAALDAMGI